MNKKIYAKTMNPEWFDYRMYEDDIAENIIIDGGRDFASINEDKLCDIRKLINAYEGWDYEYYYHNSIKDCVNDYLKKNNGKKLSPKELHIVKKALESDYRYHSEYEEEVAIACLSIIYGEEYDSFGIRGCCQGDYAKVYAPKNTSRKYIDYIEAIYFNTGIEVMVHDENNRVRNANDISGWTFYTDAWNDDDIKEEVANQCGCKVTQVVLFKFNGYSKVECYEKC